MDEVEYADAHTTQLTGVIADAAAWTQHETSAPQMMAGLAEARLLEALIVIGGAKRVLEIGTFTGVGALAMAEAVGPGGTVTTLEIDPDTAANAQRHFDASRVGDRITMIVGDALETIAQLDGPFDLVWVDAWKADYPDYYEAVLPKLAPRGVIVGDNLFRAGATIDPANQEEGTVGMRAFADRIHADERVHNVLLTIGDGVMLAWRSPE